VTDTRCQPRLQWIADRLTRWHVPVLHCHSHEAALEPHAGFSQQPLSTYHLPVFTSFTYNTMNIANPSQSITSVYRLPLYSCWECAELGSRQKAITIKGAVATLDRLPHARELSFRHQTSHSSGAQTSGCKAILRPIFHRQYLAVNEQRKGEEESHLLG